VKRSDRIKLNFSRNWHLPGKERIAGWLKLSSNAQDHLKDGIIWLRDENIALYSSADNYIENTILRTGTYESEIGKLIYSLLKKGDITIDIGANIGLQSLRMALSVGTEGQVLAFEPLTYLQQKLSRNILLNGVTNISVLPVALSNTECVKAFSICSDVWNQGTFSLRQETNEENKQEVIIKKGDDLPEINALKKIHLIKIDVEGFEFAVMQGLKNRIGEHRPKIIFEYDAHYWHLSNSNIAACYDFLLQMDYTLYQIREANAEIIRSASSIENGNVLCIPGDKKINDKR